MVSDKMGITGLGYENRRADRAVECSLIGTSSRNGADEPVETPGDGIDRSICSQA